MRLKKVILLVGKNEQDLSVLKFILDTNGYRLISTMDVDEALILFTQSIMLDLVITDIETPHSTGLQLIGVMKELNPYVPVILLGDPKKMSEVLHGADAVLDKKMISTGELLERIKCMTTRKRGPRKGTQSGRLSDPDHLVASACLVNST